MPSKPQPSYTGDKDWVIWLAAIVAPTVIILAVIYAATTCG